MAHPFARCFHMAHVLDPPPTIAAPDPVRAALSDPETMVKIVLMAKMMIRRLARTNNRTECDLAAEEIASEAVMIALRKAGDYDPVLATVNTWIQGFVRNLAMKYRDARKMCSSSEFPADVADTNESVQERLIRDADGVQVRIAIANLDAKDQKLVQLKYVELLSSGEIGEILGINAGNVRVRLNRIHNELRPMLSAAFEGGQS